MNKAELNSYYWAVVVKNISMSAKRPPTSVHNVLKWKFIKSPFGSTSKMDAIEFEGYLEKCREYAKKTYGMDISLPTNKEENGQ